MKWLFCVFSSILLTGCLNYHSSTNLENKNKIYNGKATFSVDPLRGEKDVLFILALSGGGSRAATFSANVMLELGTVFPEKDLLKEVDAISAVSGGSLPAAYYVISSDRIDEADQEYSGRLWAKDDVLELMRKNYILEWFVNWFLPNNVLKFWFTAHDRSDIMANVFRRSLYSSDKHPFSMKHLKQNRPFLILNATNATKDNTQIDFGTPFTFTSEDFKKINSDINEYDLARSVMATATFPGVFNYMTLENHFKKGTYLHVYDGGNSDNLGLKSVERILNTINKNQTPNIKSIIVILVDAFTGGSGVEQNENEPREIQDFFFDTNVLDSTDNLLANNRLSVIQNFKTTLVNHISQNQLNPRNSLFYHLEFKDIPDKSLVKELRSIKTNFKISSDHADLVEKATTKLINSENSCLIKIKNILDGKPRSEGNIECKSKN